MSELEKIFSLLNDNNQVLDEVDTPEEGVIQRKKRDILKDVIKKGKAYLLGGNKSWSIDQIDKANDKVIDKLYQNYTQLEMREKAENTGKTMGTHIVKLYTNGVNKFLKIDDPIALRRDIEEDPIIKDSMADIGALMVLTFGKWLAPLLITCHTANHTLWQKGEIKDDDDENQDESLEQF